jgi:phosphate transport system substrate-binding protein
MAPALGLAETIKIGGTGAALGTMRALIAEFAKVAPAHTVVFVPNLGTPGGIKAVAAGAIEIAAISRPLKPEESAQGLVAFEYGKNPFVFATSKNEAGSLQNLAELADMIGGRRTTWAGGAPIRLVMRPQKDVDTEILGAISPALKQAIPVALAKPGIYIAPTDQDAAEAIEKTPGAIGTTSLALLRTEKNDVRILPIDGIVPSPAAVADGSYPYFKVMFLARKGAGTPGMAQFFDFVASRQGRQILIAAGHFVGDIKPTR